MPRDDFPERTKKVMASRVGWRCSHPSCRRLTVGPKQGDVDGFHLAGRAAHITAAAPGGPRYDRTLSPTQRRHLSNGLWLCTLHASLIDTDELNYSVATLQQWRSLAEYRAHSELADEPFDQPEPHTLVAFGFDVVVQAIWRGGDPDRFIFDIASFVEGDLATLRTFIQTDARPPGSSFITVESQGDGRLIRGAMTWEQVGSFTRVSVPVAPRPSRRSPHDSGADLALGPDGDLLLQDGDLAMVQGLEAAKQSVYSCLSTGIGELVMHPEFGSRWRRLAERHGGDLRLLSRLFLLDAARLISVPEGGEAEPPMDFVERVVALEIISLDLSNNRAEVRLALLWSSTGEHWQTQHSFVLPPERQRSLPPRA